MSEDCTVCRLIRLYLLIAAPLLAILGSSVLSESGSLDYVPGVILIDLLAYGALALLFVILAVKYYREFWQPRRSRKKLDSLRMSSHDVDIE